MNGSTIGFFNSSRDRRQGDPLSLHLFVLAMEALSRMISTLVPHGFLTGFSVRNLSRGLINIAHLLFADDSLLFYEVDHNQLRTLRALLLCFKAVSGLKVNFDKFELVHVGNVNNTRQLADS